MKLRRPKTRVVKISVLELEGGVAVAGSVHNVQVYETSSDEVFALIKALLVERADDGDNAAWTLDEPEPTS